MVIESLQNPKIKNLVKLQEKSRERKKQELFVVEGIQENELALKGGFEPIEMYVCSPIFQNSFTLPEVKIFELSAVLYQKIAYRGTTEGIIGIYQMKKFSLEHIKIKNDPVIVILEAVEKPGNLGAILRTCDGAGVDLLVVCDPLVDFFNPNVIRSSVGTVFTNQVISVQKEKLISWLKEKKIQIASTFLREDTKSLYDVHFKNGVALVFGTEAKGLTNFWAENSDFLIKIPMRGKVDSLNVSNAAAICIYEIVRQKI